MFIRPLDKENRIIMKNPLVSIIVPVYNVEKYISECIESIQKQTYENLQIILVDDGSTDQSGAVCRAYAEKDQRIKVIHQQNGGPVPARKHGLEFAEGEYIGFVDSDDNIDPDMYQVLTNIMETSGADFVHSGYWENENKKAVNGQRVIELLDRDRKYKFLKDAVLGTEYYVSPSIWSKLFKADLIKESYMQISNTCQLGEDLINLCICVMRCSKVALVDGAYYHYRSRQESLSRKKTFDSLKDTIKMYEGICEVLVLYGYYQKLANVMDRLLWDSLLKCINRIGGWFQLEKYFFDDLDILEGKKVVVYGAGRVGRDYYAQICRYMGCRVVAWADVCPEKYDYPHIKLCGIEDLNNIVFDILVIAVKDKEIADEICVQLVAEGIERSKIYWPEPKILLPDDMQGK